MRTFLSICVFAVFIIPGTCLMCESCTAQKSKNCSGPLVMCDSYVTSCMSSLIVVLSGKTEYTIAQKLCGHIPWVCNLSYKMTVENLHIAAKAQCCEEDRCNTDVPKITAQNMTKNGLQCNTCSEQGLGGCKPNGLMNCTGLETKCIKYAGELNIGGKSTKVSYQGCVTPNVCLYTSISSQADGYYISCSDPVVSPPDLK